ncbi:MAG: hypothetical protein QOF55_376 [Thermoleophilaceae bacterium]|nr:hypothetical protein [Thermoleophilaceae bacterium]
MLHAIFDMGISVGEKALRALLVYGFLLAALRVLGKRELAQQNTLDLLVILLVANAVQNGIIGNDNSVTGAVVGATVLFGLHRLFGALAYRYPWADRLFEGGPSNLIMDGKPVAATLRHEQISRPQLLAMAQRQGFDGLGNIDRAILETDGSVKFVAKGDSYDPGAHPPTPARERSPRPPRGQPA